MKQIFEEIGGAAIYAIAGAGILGILCFLLAELAG